LRGESGLYETRNYTGKCFLQQAAAYHITTSAGQWFAGLSA